MFVRHSRRGFLKLLSAAGLGGILPVTGYSQGNLPAAGGIISRPIPGTGELLPVMGFGSSAAVMAIPETGPAPVERLIDTLIRLGGTMIDTAPRQESLDEAFGALLTDPRWRDRLFVNTKVGRNRAENVMSQDAEGVVNLMRRTERLFGKRPSDLVLIDNMDDIDRHWPVLRQAKTGGGARYIGVTTSNTSDHERLEAFMRLNGPDFIQVNYSLLEPDAGDRILPLARELGIAVIINTPFGGGEYFQKVGGRPLPAWAAEFDCTSWAQYNLKYILGEPAVNCVLTETTNVTHLVENIGAATGRLPDAGMRDDMKAWFDSL